MGSHVSVDHVLLQRDAWKQVPKHDSGGFFCSNSLWLFPHRSARLCGKNIPMWPSASTRQELPHSLPEDSTLTLELSLSLSLLSHVHTDTHTYTSIMTHLHLPTSAVSHRSNSPCCHRPLLVVASSCWLPIRIFHRLFVCLIEKSWVWRGFYVGSSVKNDAVLWRKRNGAVGEAPHPRPEVWPGSSMVKAASWPEAPGFSVLVEEEFAFFPSSFSQDRRTRVLWQIPNWSRYL